MIDFFTYIVRVKHDSYYNNLSIHHMVVILLFLLGIIFIYKLTRFDTNLVRTKKLDTVLTIVLVITQIIYYSWYIITNGDYDPYPLYICRISAIVLCVTAIWKSKALEDFAILSGLYGSICAIILSSPSPFAFPHIMRLSYFVLHFCLDYLALTRLIYRRSKVGWRMFGDACIVNALVLSGVYVVNKVYDWNYSFLIYPPLFYDTYLKMNATLYIICAFLTYFVLLFIGYALSKIVTRRL